MRQKSALKSVWGDGAAVVVMFTSSHQGAEFLMCFYCFSVIFGTASTAMCLIHWHFLCALVTNVSRTIHSGVEGGVEGGGDR